MLGKRALNAMTLSRNEGVRRGRHIKCVRRGGFGVIVDSDLKFTGGFADPSSALPLNTEIHELNVCIVDANAALYTSLHYIFPLIISILILVLTTLNLISLTFQIITIIIPR